jgi:hypothetical protein
MTYRHTIIRCMGTATVTIAIACGAAAAAASGASATSPGPSGPITTLHLYAVDQYNAMFQANGQPMSPSAQPAPGDYIVGVDEDYLGTHLGHSKTSTGADNSVCTFTGPTTGICDQVIALGGSLLLFDHVTVNFALKSPVSEITGGTGIFEGAHGTVTVTSLPTTNSDFVVRYWT